MVASVEVSEQLNSIKMLLELLHNDRGSINSSSSLAQASISNTAEFRA
jgi:hypothetical protein